MAKNSLKKLLREEDVKRRQLQQQAATNNLSPEEKLEEIISIASKHPETAKKINFIKENGYDIAILPKGADIIYGYGGYCDGKNKKIAINPYFTTGKQIGTLIHEVSHAYRHLKYNTFSKDGKNNDLNYDIKSQILLNRIQEAEGFCDSAEAITYLYHKGVKEPFVETTKDPKEYCTKINLAYMTELTKNPKNAYFHAFEKFFGDEELISSYDNDARKNINSFIKEEGFNQEKHLSEELTFADLYKRINSADKMESLSINIKSELFKDSFFGGFSKESKEKTIDICKQYQKAIPELQSKKAHKVWLKQLKHKQKFSQIATNKSNSR